MNRHECPVDGCTELVVNRKLMCWYHWNMVPAWMGAKVYEEWRRRPHTAEHLEACNRAVEFVNCTLLEIRY